MSDNAIFTYEDFQRLHADNAQFWTREEFQALILPWWKWRAWTGHELFLEWVTANYHALLDIREGFRFATRQAKRAERHKGEVRHHERKAAASVDQARS